MRVYDVDIITEIKYGDIWNICEAVWRGLGYRVWEQSASERQSRIVEDWHKAWSGLAVPELYHTEVWQRVARRKVSKAEAKEVVDEAVRACWRALVASALERLQFERERVEEDLERLQRKRDSVKEELKRLRSERNRLKDDLEYLDGMIHELEC